MPVFAPPSACPVWHKRYICNAFYGRFTSHLDVRVGVCMPAPAPSAGCASATMTGCAGGTASTYVRTCTHILTASTASPPPPCSSMCARLRYYMLVPAVPSAHLTARATPSFRPTSPDCSRSRIRARAAAVCTRRPLHRWAEVRTTPPPAPTSGAEPSGVEVEPWNRPPRPRTGPRGRAT